MRVLTLVALVGIATQAWAASPPTVARFPTVEEFVAAAPSRAVFENIGGRVSLDCTVKTDGELRDCAVASETPAAYGFGAAALGLQAKVQVRMTASTPSRLLIPMAFPAPKPLEAKFKSSSANVRLGGAGPYYPDRAARAGQGGAVILACDCDATGALNDCRVVNEAPRGENFGDAAMMMALKGWMTVAPRRAQPIAPNEPVLVLVTFGNTRR